MDDLIIIVLVAILLALVAIGGALILMTLNIKKRKYIETHQEKAVAIDKIARRSGEEKLELPTTSLNGFSFFISLRLRDGSQQEFSISYKQFCMIRKGETATVCVIDDRLIHYESDHSLSKEFNSDLSEMYSFFHHRKQGKTVDFYCEIPSINVVIYSYEPISLDYSEILEVYQQMSFTTEEFFCIQHPHTEDSLEVVTYDRGTDIIIPLEDDLMEVLIEDRTIVEKLIFEWFNNKLNPKDYDFKSISDFLE